MQELLTNAVNGWYRYTDSGKYAVLFLGAVVFLWFRARRLEKTGLSVLLYATVGAALAICPVTAVILMKYQTRFYDYEWVWSGVPVTLVIAWGMTEVYLELSRNHFKEKKWAPAGLAAVGLLLIWLCGSMPGSGQGSGMQDRLLHSEGEQKAAAIVDIIAEKGNTEVICLWAPRDILQYVRGISGEITLLYGRNMWEESLNAYAYDTYDEEMCGLYGWMEDLTAAEAGTGEVTPAEVFGEEKEQYLMSALNRGVNCIVLPGQTADGMDGMLKPLISDKGLKVTREAAGNYHILWITEQ